MKIIKIIFIFLQNFLMNNFLAGLTKILPIKVFSNPQNIIILSAGSTVYL